MPDRNEKDNESDDSCQTLYAINYCAFVDQVRKYRTEEPELDPDDEYHRKHHAIAREKHMKAN